MGEKLDRGMQRDLMQALFDAYPDIVEANNLAGLAPGTALRVNLSYLAEHGLVSAKVVHDLSEGPQIVWAKITNKGIDFLADDGGLGAILGVVTVRLHQDTIRALLIQRVEESDASDTVKGKLIAQLKALPAEGIGTIAEKVLEAGLQALPNAVLLLQRALAG